MEIPKSLKDKFAELNSSTFEALKKAEYKPPHDIYSLRHFRDKAGNERNLRELYRDRTAYELLQNADDTKAKNVAFILEKDGLAFAHDGRWFTIQNFRNLADGWSDKNPDECIGHKGLGFRSVLDITPSPYLLKVDDKGFFAVKFSWALNNGHIQETLNKDPALRDHYSEWTKHGQLACPVMYIPGTARKLNLGGGSAVLDRLVGGKYEGRFTTMFWFPSEDPDIDRKVLRELGPTPIIDNPQGQRAICAFLKDEVSRLLPFLSHVLSVRVYSQNQRISSARIGAPREERKESGFEIKLEVEGEKSPTSFFQMRFKCPIPLEIKNLPQTPKAVQGIERAEIVTSVRLQDGHPVCDSNASFHVYFPTTEKTGLGFVIHGDFFVKPDRTRLMDGKYNEWLLGQAAKKVANEFLTNLLKRYGFKDSFSALSPTEVPSAGAAKYFVSKFSQELRARKDAFVPGVSGLLARDEVAIPPRIDKEGFWSGHFSDVLSNVIPGKIDFLSPQEDDLKTRDFLGLADIQPIPRLRFVDFLEASADFKRNPAWWYDCYAYMAHDEKLSQLTHADFVGRRILPTEDAGVLEVQENQSRVVCFPPPEESAHLRVPACFSRVFVFLDTELARCLREGNDVVQIWALNRFRIAKFEATDLLPRAVTAVAPDFFSGDLSLSEKSLREAWTFLRDTIAYSRAIHSEDFWRVIGRFPLPTAAEKEGGFLKASHLVPVFLMYWPDSLSEEDSCLSGVADLRRLDENFYASLCSDADGSREQWTEFLGKVGLCSSPKLLQFRRLAVGGEDLELSPNALKTFDCCRFTGDRQRDENIAAVLALKAGGLWESALAAAGRCEHPGTKVVGTLTVLEGFAECINAAQTEFEKNDDRWQKRLTLLTKELPLHSLSDISPDTTFCRAGKSGGHTLPAGSRLRRQLEQNHWLPSTRGPATSSECFLRQSTRRFITAGRGDEELGDLLLPYVVVDNLKDALRLQGLGLDMLEDAASAVPSVLIRALGILGHALSSDWGKTEILGVRSRWRLVRGAIQEAYRRLNQSDDSLDFTSHTKWVVRSSKGPEIALLPLYYAEPGSAVESAFMDLLPLLDTDRSFRKLFDSAGIVQLEVGTTVEERFLSEPSSQSLDTLRDQMVKSLGPYLLAPLIAKSDQHKHSELVVKRLNQWFQVKTARNLEVSFGLKSDRTLERTVQFPHFYLQRERVQRDGAIQEMHYTLNVTGDGTASLYSLDADALGQALAPVFLDGISNELFDFFPRIVSRFTYARGEPADLENFMFYRLGISREALDMARAMITGEIAEVPPSPPPAPKAITDGFGSNRQQIDIEDFNKKVEDSFKKGAEDFSNTLANDQQDPACKSGTTNRGGRLQHDEPTPEQQLRGEKGEEEIKRRLELPEGWAGLKLVADKRKERCGYDFLCEEDGNNVELEVKTFTKNGRVIVSSDELQAAVSSAERYYLLGVLDDGGPTTEWQTILLRNPFPVLIQKGKLAIRTKLEVAAADIFDFH